MVAQASRFALPIVGVALLDVALVCRDQRTRSSQLVYQIENSLLLGRGDRYGALTSALGPTAFEGDVVAPVRIARLEIVWGAQYRAWGVAQEVIRKAAGKASNPIRFQGQYHDHETGLHYNRYRYYDPEVGRFVSKDPIGYAGGLSLYKYAPNSINWVDPLGLDTYIINRDLAAFGDSARSRWNIVTHTFTATTKSDGSIAHTYSWGNDANLMGWNQDQLLDIKTAREAINQGLAEKVGGPEMDLAIFQAYRDLDRKENEHANWILFRNCKTETGKLHDRTREIMRSRHN
nr:RHS repeat-associated core domain-containing protein [Paraburkholderia hayleyella]